MGAVSEDEDALGFLEGEEEVLEVEVGEDCCFFGSGYERFVPFCFSAADAGFTRLKPRNFLVVQLSRLSMLTSVCSSSISMISSLFFSIESFLFSTLCWFR